MKTFWTTPSKCGHDYVLGPTEVTRLGGGLEVRNTPKRCQLCGKRDHVIGIWMVARQDGTVYECIIPMNFVGCYPDDGY